MAGEFRIEMELSSEELMKFGQAVAAICFFPRYVASEARRIEETPNSLESLSELISQAERAKEIGEWLAVKIGEHEPKRIEKGPVQ